MNIYVLQCPLGDFSTISYSNIFAPQKNLQSAWPTGVSPSISVVVRHQTGTCRGQGKSTSSRGTSQVKHREFRRRSEHCITISDVSPQGIRLCHPSWPCVAAVSILHAWCLPDCSSTTSRFPHIHPSVATLTLPVKSLLSALRTNSE